MNNDNYHNFERAMDVLEKQYNMETGTLPMSAEQEEKYTAMMSMMKKMMPEYDRRNPGMRNRKKRIQPHSALQKVAIILICVVAVGTVTAPSADAVRLKIQKFFSWEEEENTVFVPSDTKVMDNWENYFVLCSLPEGYTQTYAENLGQYKAIVYENEEKSIMLEQNSASTVISVDNENTSCEEVNLLGNEGQYFNNERDAVTSIYVLKGNYLLTVYTRGEGRLQGQELIDFLNNNLTFIK